MTAAAAIEPSWDERVDALADAAGARARKAASAALKRGTTTDRLLMATSDAVDAFTATHPDTAYGIPQNRAQGRRQRFDDLFWALVTGQIGRDAYRPIETLVEHAFAIGPFPIGWQPSLYLGMVRWLVAPEPSIPALLKLIAGVAEYFVRWQADDDLADCGNSEVPCSPQAKRAADTFVAALLKAGAA